MRAKLSFVWILLGLWAGWRGDPTHGLVCLLLAETCLIMVRLDKLEEGIGQAKQATVTVTKSS